MFREREVIKKVEARNLSRRSTTTTALGCIDKLIVEFKKGIITNAGAFELQCGTTFVHSRIKDIVDGMRPSEYLPTRAWSSYIRCVMPGRYVSRNCEVLPALERLRFEHELCEERAFRTWTATCSVLLKMSSCI